MVSGLLATGEGSELRRPQPGSGSGSAVPCGQVVELRGADFILPETRSPHSARGSNKVLVFTEN